MNAYLPTLARDSEEVVKCRADLQSALDSAGPGPTRISSDADAGITTNPESESSEPLLSGQSGTIERGDAEGDATEVTTFRNTYNSALSRATSRISSQGIALGYAAGILLLIIALIPVNLLHGSTFALRLAIGLSGIWWAVFSLPAAAWLPSSSNIVKEDEWDVGEGEDGSGAGLVKQEWSTTREIGKAWKRLGGMLSWREIKRLRNTFQYLAAWFLLSDGKP